MSDTHKSISKRNGFIKVLAFIVRAYLVVCGLFLNALILHACLEVSGFFCDLDRQQIRACILAYEAQEIQYLHYDSTGTWGYNGCIIHPGETLENTDLSIPYFHDYMIQFEVDSNICNISVISTDEQDGEPAWFLEWEISDSDPCPTQDTANFEVKII